jgi:hypothetical protein
MAPTDGNTPGGGDTPEPRLQPFEGLHEEGFEEGLDLGSAADASMEDLGGPELSLEDHLPRTGFGLFGQADRTPSGCLWALVVFVLVAIVAVLYLFSGGEDPAPSGDSAPSGVDFSPAAGNESSTDEQADSGAEDDGGEPTGEGSTDDQPDLPDAAAPGLVLEDLIPEGDGAWTFTEDPPAVECDIPGMDASLPPIGSSAGSGFLEFIDGGERLRAIDTDGTAIEVGRVDTDDGTVKYQGTIPAAEFAPGLDGVIGEFTFTVVFESEERATTHLVGSIGTSGMTCTFERSGVATRTG